MGELLELAVTMGEVGQDLKKTMFLNLFNESGERFRGRDFHWTMSGLLARMMVNPLLEAEGSAPKDLGVLARELFACSYRLQMASGITQRLGRHDSLGAFYAQRSGEVEAQMSTLAAEIPAEQMKIISTLLTKEKLPLPPGLRPS